MKSLWNRGGEYKDLLKTATSVFPGTVSYTGIFNLIYLRLLKSELYPGRRFLCV